MKTMKMKIVWVGILLVSNALFFWGGLVMGRTTTSKVYDQLVEYGEAITAVANYRAYRDIALGIKESRYDAARCRAEFAANWNLSIAKPCLADLGCRKELEYTVRKDAPEVLGEAAVPIELRTECPYDGVRRSQ